MLDKHWVTQLILAISLWGYLPLIRKDCSTHMHGLAVYPRDLSLEHLQILTYVFDLLYFTHCLTSFSPIDHVLRLYTWFLILFHLA